MTTKSALVGLLVAVLAVVAYHFGSSAEQTDPTGLDADMRLAQMETRLQAVEDACRAPDPPDACGAHDRIARLERRLAALEAAGPYGETMHTGTPPEGVAAGDLPIIEAARAAANQKNLEMATARYRTRILSLEPHTSDVDLAAAARLLAEYAAAIRELYDGSHEASEERRAELGQRHEELRRELQFGLRAYLSDASVEHLTREHSRNR